jgi:hypothetical protein
MYDPVMSRDGQQRNPMTAAPEVSITTTPVPPPRAATVY